uniref:Uncharacterized protein n=1 Tax=Rhizophora mucronata TaxID=61149 RepID=A0A2P2PPE9_RHIMU
MKLKNFKNLLIA